ncbi:peptidylprolyl isomerase [Nocardia sp. BMG51109]|uniref:peptidylprolyl isomerase n=1 Tax=Nocardia sp. BMG51109 TaxID=1056816 RepID=UPI0004641B74|nr:peptidylprolyl isomerase [Nocardia sp. BMG51109]
MNSFPQLPRPEADRSKHRISKQRKVLRGLGFAAAGVAIALLGTGPSVAAPARPHTAAPGCMAPSGPQPNGKQWPAEPGMSIDPGYPYAATLQTNCGAITVDLDAAHAPRTVNSFAFLAGEQYFDHTRCHRLTTEGLFVLQCGDPTATGSGGPGYRFPDENLTGATYPAGTVAMANAGPDTNGSQFFLVYSDSPLPPHYTPFGRVTAGMDVLQNIAAGGTKDGSADGAPATDIVFESVTAQHS